MDPKAPDIAVEMTEMVGGSSEGDDASELKTSFVGAIKLRGIRAVDKIFILGVLTSWGHCGKSETACLYWRLYHRCQYFGGC